MTTENINLPTIIASTQAGYNAANTSLDVMLDSAAARPIALEYPTPLFSTDQMTMMHPLTLKQIQALAPKVLTDSLLAQIDAGLSNLGKGS